VLAADATVVSAAAMGSALSLADRGPVLVRTSQTVPGPDAGAALAAPALAPELNVTSGTLVGAALANGNQTLTHSTDKVHDAIAGTRGGVQVDKFFRQLGSANGDWTIDLTDVAQLFSAFDMRRE
jgi:hypothetical protein